MTTKEGRTPLPNTGPSHSGSTAAPVQVAVLMACHNRRVGTLKCLAALSKQQDANAELLLYLTDDGSTDGTATAVAETWPGAHILHGDGSLYWAASMALAERAAWWSEPDYLLWLNDDSALAEGGLARLLHQAKRTPDTVLVGCVADPITREPTYGGRMRVDGHPQRLRRLPIARHAQFADTFNGNVVLIPASVRARVGPIDGLFPHAYADDDYGLRARALGVQIVQVPGVTAWGEINPNGLNLSGGILERWRQLQSPKALPWRGQARFLRRHAGFRWPALLVAGQMSRVLGRRQ